VVLRKSGDRPMSPSRLRRRSGTPHDRHGGPRPTSLARTRSGPGRGAGQASADAAPPAHRKPVRSCPAGCGPVPTGRRRFRACARPPARCPGTVRRVERREAAHVQEPRVRPAALPVTAVGRTPRGTAGICRDSGQNASCSYSPQKLGFFQSLKLGCLETSSRSRQPKTSRLTVTDLDLARSGTHA
jgi:hypothetical protein